MNSPIPLPAVPARGNQGTRLPGKRPSPADGLTSLPIAWPKREGVPRFGPQSRPAVRRGRTRTARITESGAKPAGSRRSGAENAQESGHGGSSAAFTFALRGARRSSTFRYTTHSYRDGSAPTDVYTLLAPTSRVEVTCPNTTAHQVAAGSSRHRGEIGRIVRAAPVRRLLTPRLPCP